MAETLKQVDDSKILFDGERSCTGQLWAMRSFDERQALAIAQSHNLPDRLAGIIAGKGVQLSDVESYLNPTLKQLMPDPQHLLDMNKAVGRTITAIKAKQNITVFGDYDVDGATSSALLRRYFADIGCPIALYIPDRIDEGYGPNKKAMRTLSSRRANLIIMVDCGTTAFDALETAKEEGLDVIVLDHHTAQPKLPDVVAVVNPNRLDQESQLGSLCAAGVSFMFIVELQRQLRAQGFFADRVEPDLRQYLDLVALGTVCDVMPLKGLNRAFVTQGLKIMHMRNNAGIAALADIAAVEERPTAYHLGFMIGPRVNAGGRVGQADIGSRLLSTNDKSEAQTLAQQLNIFNQERQQIEAQVLQESMEQIEAKELDKKPLLMVKGNDWHPGVIGIVAGRLKEKYKRPACVVSMTGGVGKGSGRSVPGVVMGAAMHAALQSQLLLNGGGHAMAAGFTVSPEKYDDFYEFLLERLAPELAGYTPSYKLDCAISLGGVSVELLEKLQMLEPFGQGNAAPRFMLSPVRISRVMPVGKDHLRIPMESEDGGRLDGICFRCVNTELGDALMTAQGKLVSVAGTLKLDTWGGRRKASFILDDLHYQY